MKALEQFANDLDAGEPMHLKYTVRTVRVIPEPSAYAPARVRAVRELIGASQSVFAQLLAVSPMTVRSWEQGSRQPSAIARRFLEEIEMAPQHFRGRILAVGLGAERTAQLSGISKANVPKRSRGRTPIAKRTRGGSPNHQ